MFIKDNIQGKYKRQIKNTEINMKRIFLEDENKTKELGEKLGKVVDAG